MNIYQHTPELEEWINSVKNSGKIIGFVPTMGALHKGHLSLVERSASECDHTVVSIFVNPKQFNDPEDLKKYPRTLEADLVNLKAVSADVVFTPDVEEVYPPGDMLSLDFDPGPAATIMEGEFRPGHFQGMAEVVYRLLTIVRPDKLFMGQKDFQQLVVVRKMITDLQLPVLLEMCPTVREHNGLAMSSRNERLSQEARDKAGIIYEMLVKSKQSFDENVPVTDIKRNALESLAKAGFDPEYFEIIDGVTMENIVSRHESQFVVACCAVKIEGIRLIDNDIWIRNE